MFKYIDFNKSISTVNERPISVVIKRKKKHNYIYIEVNIVCILLKFIWHAASTCSQRGKKNQ